jgi:hypothetical protein
MLMALASAVFLGSESLGTSDHILLSVGFWVGFIYLIHSQLGTTGNRALSLIYTLYNSPIHTHYGFRSSLVLCYLLVGSTVTRESTPLCRIMLCYSIIFILFVMFYSFVFLCNFVLSYCITRHCIVLSLVYNFNIFIATYVRNICI